jgi:hypothetical protein
MKDRETFIKKEEERKEGREKEEERNIEED